MRQLIGIAGKAHSGKDTCANYLWTHYEFTRLAFADPLKRAAGKVFGLADVSLANDPSKEDPHPYWGISKREMYQRLGEAVKKEFGVGHWVSRWAMTYDMIRESDHVVVPDVRFEVEAETIRTFGGTIVHVLRPDENGLVGETANHVSEAGIAYYENDFVVINDGTIDDLYAKLDFVIHAIAERGA